MIENIEQARAVLADYTFYTGTNNVQLRDALAFALAEHARLTAPLDADEGRELVERMRNGRGWKWQDTADYIERQATQLAAKDEDVRELKTLVDELTEEARLCRHDISLLQAQLRKLINAELLCLRFFRDIGFERRREAFKAYDMPVEQITTHADETMVFNMLLKDHGNEFADRIEAQLAALQQLPHDVEGLPSFWEDVAAIFDFRTDMLMAKRARETAQALRSYSAEHLQLVKLIGEVMKRRDEAIQESVQASAELARRDRVDADVRDALRETVAAIEATDHHARSNVEERALRKALAILATQPAEARSAQEVGECHGLDTPERVCFYEQDFYVLSNFSAFRVWWKGRTFDTSEAAYHWEKFPDHAAIQFDIEAADSAHEAFKVAERNKPFRRDDWDDVKVDVMRDILRAKAAQHEYVHRKLLATGDRELVENSWRDDYWGWGPNRDGNNMLGKLWMEVRTELRAALGQPAREGE